MTEDDQQRRAAILDLAASFPELEPSVNRLADAGLTVQAAHSRLVHLWRRRRVLEAIRWMEELQQLRNLRVCADIDDVTEHEALLRRLIFQSVDAVFGNELVIIAT